MSSRGLSLAKELTFYIYNHHAWVEPRGLILWKDMDREHPEKPLQDGEGDTYYVHLAVGRQNLLKWLEMAPAPKRWIAFYRVKSAGPEGHRPDQLKFYSFDRFKSLVSRLDSI